MGKKKSESDKASKKKFSNPHFDQDDTDGDVTFTNPALAGDTSSDEDDAPLRTKKDWFSKKKKGEGGQDSEQKKSGNVVMSSLQSGPMTLSGVFGDSDNSDDDLDPLAARRVCLGLLHPETHIRQIYDLIQMLILLYFMFILPYRLGFQLEPEGTAAFIDVVIDGVLVFDLFLNFHAFYFDGHGLLVTNSHTIRNNYLKSWFFVDFMTVCPFDQVFRILALASTDETFQTSLAFLANEVRTLKLIRLIKLGRLKELIDPQKLAHMVAVMLEPLGIHNVELQAMFYFRMLVLLFVLLSTVHVSACWWANIGMTNVNNGTGWIVAQFGEDDASGTYAKYKTAFYFVVVTMSSTGYGDMHATNHTEERACNCIIITGIFLISYIVGTFGMMIANIAAQQNAFDAKMRSVSNMMDLMDVDVKVKARVHSFYHKRNHNEEFKEVYLELPGAVRRKLMKARYSYILQKIPFLSGLDELVLVKICSLVKEYSVMPGDIVCRGGDPRQDLLLVTVGLVTIMPPSPNDAENGEPSVQNRGSGMPHDTHGREHDIPGEDRGAGCYFGMDEFIGLRGTTSVTLRARAYTEVSVLSRHALDKVLGEHPDLAMRIAQYAAAQREIVEMLSDGQLDDNELARLHEMHERIEDDAAAAAALGDHHHYAEGEVSMINVLAQDVSTKLEFEVLRERLDGLEGAVSEMRDTMFFIAKKVGVAEKNMPQAAGEGLDTSKRASKSLVRKAVNLPGGVVRAAVPGMKQKR